MLIMIGSKNTNFVEDFEYLPYGFILKHMLIMVDSKNTKLLEYFEYMQFEKTHKWSDGRTDIYPNNGCVCLRLRCTKCLGQSEVGRSSFFPIDRPGKHKLGLALGVHVLASVQRWYLASCVVSLHSGSMNTNWEYSQVKIQMLFFFSVFEYIHVELVCCVWIHKIVFKYHEEV